ncbi:MAG TPA: hypothetical protein VK437_03315 [Steroidobacteraceae bacterium]|nr:hypothetical protein [Steroidobacteraceae bacterium]
MEVVEETLRLLQRQAELEAAMRKPGGIRITEERELQALRGRLARFPQAMEAVMQASQALRRPLADMTVHDVKSWARS